MPSIPLTYHYIQLFAPSHTEELSLRKVLADALGQSYGLSRALTYIDVLAIDAAKGEATIRVSSGDVEVVLGSIAAYSPPSGAKLSVLKDSAFLPALAANSRSWVKDLE